MNLTVSDFDVIVKLPTSFDYLAVGGHIVKSTSRAHEAADFDHGVITIQIRHCMAAQESI